MKTAHVKELIPSRDVIAYCGLYCGACPSYLKGKCPGCRDNVRATWCTVRKCCRENNFQTCAECEFVELSECKKYNTFISKVIGFMLNSDRSACIKRIREIGPEAFAIEMTESRKMTIRRK
jgi:hypothetical protein